MHFAIVGAGFSGAILAYHLSKKGHDITVFESRDHVGGNCYTHEDEDTGITVHKYGPHIFHTDNDEVWKFVNQFADFEPYINRVKTTSNDAVYSLPINLLTINQFFNKTFSPNEAKDFISTMGDQSITNPISFEDQALKFLGKDLYEAFFKGYTIKQWGIDPKNLPASILKRLPVRFNYDDNYFNHRYQGMPVGGYTQIFDKLLKNDQINVLLNTSFDKSKAENYDHIFNTGPIDSWFDQCFGELAYRTLDFRKEIHEGDYQGCAVMNYNDESVPFTRISEHKYFTPSLTFNKTIIFKEFSRVCGKDDIPYYPIRLVDDKEVLTKYIELAKKTEGISFLGRLGTYRYLDMDKTIEEAILASEIVIKSLQDKTVIPSFFVDPS